MSLPLSSLSVLAEDFPSVQNLPDKIIPVEGTAGIKLSKTAKPVAGMVNQWDITLRIEAPKSTKTSDTVLVIDRSGSMSGSRMTNAKAAANSLIDKLLTTGNTTNRVAVVSFAGSPYNTLTDVTVNTDFTTNRTTARNAVNSLVADGGTHTQAGMRKAADLIGESTADFKNVILLSDGQPTFCYGVNSPWKMNTSNLIPYPDNGWQTPTTVPNEQFNNDRVGAGNSMYQRYDNPWGTSDDKWYNCGNHAIAEAGFFKNTHPSGLYTIALDAGTTGTPILEAMASPGKAYATSDETQLTAIFNEIAGKIANYIQSASVVDTIGDGIKLTGGGGAINWTPEFTQDGDKFVATKTYRIELDGTKLVDGVNSWYNANQSAILTYNDGQTGEFPIPKVDPTLVKIKKVLDGDVCNGCKYTFKLTAPDNSVEYHEVEAGQTKTLYHPMKVGNYTIIEDSAKDAGGNSISLNQYDTTISPTNTYALALAGADVAITATNKLKTTDVEATKVWSGGENLGTSRPTVWFKLFRQVGNGPAEAVPSAAIKELDGITSVKWEGVASHRSSDGQAYTFSVKEVDANGNDFVPTDYAKVEEGLAVTNKYIPKKITVTAKKTWVGGDSLGDRPTIWFELYRNIANENPAPVTGAELKELQHGTTEVSWANQDETDINGNLYTYTVKEVNAEGADYTPHLYAKTESELTVTNTYKSPEIDITVEKKWSGGTYAVKPTVNVQLYRQVVGGTKNEVGDPVELDALSNPAWTYTWEDMPKTDNSGLEYTYTVAEVGGALGQFLPSYSEDTFTITNTYQIPTDGEAEATKVWTNGPSNRPSVWFKLFRNIENGDVEEVPEVEIQELPNGTTTVKWTGLKETDIEGNPYAFSVKEVDASGNDFTPANYTKSGEGTLTITNKYVSPKTDIKVTKDWKGGADRPPITVNLLRDGDEHLSVILDDDNEWTHTWEGLDKTDEDGVPYSYTVHEVVVDGYEAVVGDPDVTDELISFIITNTYQIPNDGEAIANKKWIDGPSNRPTVWFKLYRQVGEGTAEVVPGAEIKALPNGTTQVKWGKLARTDGDGKSYTFSVKEVDAAGNDFTPANYTKSGEGTLTITNKYVIPTNGKVKANKVWVNGEALHNGVRPTVWFKLYRQIEGGDKQAVPGAEVKKLVHGESLEVEWTGLEETDINGNAYTFSVEELNDEDGVSAAPAPYTKKEEGLTVTNTYTPEAIEVTAQKIWVNGSKIRPMVTFHLLRNGVEMDGPGAEVDLFPGMDGKAEHTWEGLAATDLAGNPYTYTVKETTILGEGWSASYDESELIVTNTYTIPETGSATATKEWVNGPANRPTIWFKLFRNIEDGAVEEVPESQAPIKELVSGVESVEWTNLEKTDIDGNSYIFSVKEVDEDGNDWTPANYTKSGEGTLVITNEYVIPTDGVAEATKEWVNGPETRPTIWLKLYRQIEDGEVEEVPGAEVRELTSGVTSAIWTGLEETDIDGNPYIFSVKEVDEDGNVLSDELESDLGNYKIEYSSSLAVVNTYIVPTQNITVKKVWVGGHHTTEVEVELIRDGDQVATAKLNADNNWQHTWEDMPLTDEDGEPYVYAVRELTRLSNFRTTLGGSLEDGFIITNCWLEPGKGAPDTGVGATVSPMIMLFALFLVALGIRGRKLAKQTI